MSRYDVERLLVRGQPWSIARKLEGTRSQEEVEEATQKKGSWETSQVKRWHDSEPAESWVFPEHSKLKESGFSTN